MYTYKVLKINKVVDGDTIDLTIDLGFNLTKTDRYRMMGYDAPETFRPINEKEKIAGLKVKDFFESIVTDPNANLIVETFKNTDIYGRYSCILKDIHSPVTINVIMDEYIKTNNFTKEILRG